MHKRRKVRAFFVFTLRESTLALNTQFSYIYFYGFLKLDLA